MMRFFRIIFGALAMLMVAMTACLVTMRLAIHGREVEVPNFAGMTMAEATDAAARGDLDLTLENRFYSTVVPSGRVMQQFPAPGAKVRREWQVRITESLGPQRVSIPNVVGQPERDASVSIRRASLDLGTVAYIAAPGPAGIVLAQTPPPNAEGVDRPRVSILLSQAEPGGSAVTADADSDKPGEFVMPNFLGMSASTASAKAAAVGLHVSLAQDASAIAAATLAAADADGTGAAITAAAPAPVAGGGMVTAQSPQAGHKAQRGDTVRLTLK